MNELRYITTVGQLREILAELPDDAEVAQVNPVGREGAASVQTTDDGGLPRLLIYEG